MEKCETNHKNKEHLKITLKDIEKVYIIVYVFFSGFVFFEPSITELAFLILIPITIIMGFAVQQKALILMLSALILNLMSLVWGMNRLGLLETRYCMIDIYLYINAVFLFSILKSVITDEPDFINKIMKWWIAAGIINILFGFIAYYTGKSMIFGITIINNGIRFRGFFKDPNVLGPFLVPPALYVIEKILSCKKTNLKQIIILIVLSLGIVLSFSRAAWLNYVISVFILFILYFRKHPKVSFRIIVLTLLASILLLCVLNFDFKFGGYNIAEVLKERTGLQHYDQERFGAQRMVYDMFLMSPILGIGPGNYDKITIVDAHSLYVRTLGEKGILGICVLAVFIISLITNKNSYKQNKFIISSFFGILANSLFIDTLHWRHIWIIMALLICIIKNPNKDIKYFERK